MRPKYCKIMSGTQKSPVFPCSNIYMYYTNQPKENWIQGGGIKVSVHFAVTYLDCWRTSFNVTTIIKIVNNNTNDKHSFGVSLALDEDSP